jgi:hypothetical protein
MPLKSRHHSFTHTHTHPQVKVKLMYMYTGNIQYSKDQQSQ